MTDQTLRQSSNLKLPVESFCLDKDWDVSPFGRQVLASQETPRFFSRNMESKERGFATLEEHVAEAREVLTHFQQSQHRSERHQRHQLALLWLSRNKQNWTGKWVALQGDRVLASGVTAREVFSKVADERPAPLVVKVETEQFPFGGW